MGQAAVATVVGALAAAATAAEALEAEARAEVGRAAVATVVGALAAEARAGTYSNPLPPAVAGGAPLPCWLRCGPSRPSVRRCTRA